MRTGATPTATRLCPKAQGWRKTPTLGTRFVYSSTPTGLRHDGVSICDQSQPQPQRGCVPKPRVGAARLPWGHDLFIHLPQRGCGMMLFRYENRRNPVGVVSVLNPIPRVARPSQPWAGGLSPFGAGVGGPDVSKENTSTKTAISKCHLRGIFYFAVRTVNIRFFNLRYLTEIRSNSSFATLKQPRLAGEPITLQRTSIMTGYS